ncbi:hypothetical protein HanXRQr2_Chr15g0721891 [Helianthus annuus]|uniref:Uncharacterized protein n=1 Tax=Helianthus annuus TaxID=4232 RepID=A0A9K3E5X1_HELAN|nr:hypothetical protein HanXRQr2_Chr15g0721891 [Helianthus annuus]KAJ0833607.1 hypothetical protein HanPSC8_Chr15g0692381 [Helianthus annuus]
MSAELSPEILAMGRAHSFPFHPFTLLYSSKTPPLPNDTTSRSSTPLTNGNSCLLCSTCVIAAAVGLLIAKPPSTATHFVFPSTDFIDTGSNNPGSADVARHTSHSRKSKLSLSKASARENRNGAELDKS